MTDTTTAQAAAQPVADANSIDSIINNAETEVPAEAPKVEPDKGSEPSDRVDEPWPKKAENALAKAKGKAAQLRAERDQERTARQRLEQQLAQYSQPKTQQPQGAELSVARTGIPTKLDANKFANYADFMDARAEEIADYKIDQKFTEREGKQKASEQTIKDNAWVAERETRADEQMENFGKEIPDAQALYNENADTIKNFSPEIKRAFLAADNVPLALYNLAKEGKLDDLADMSLEDVKVEIRLAQIKPLEKPRTKAPTPLAASRGSVSSGKSLDSMDGEELLSWVNS